MDGATIKIKNYAFLWLQHLKLNYILRTRGCATGLNVCFSRWTCLPGAISSGKFTEENFTWNSSFPIYLFRISFSLFLPSFVR